jgi:cytochrome c5
MKIIILSFAGLFLFACSNAKKSTTPVVEPVVKESKTTTSSRLDQGEALYGEKCSTCHELMTPSNYSEQSWKKIVPNMTVMANKKTEKINAEQEQLILEYLVANAKK